MSETILRVMLSELTTIRLRCQQPGCGGVVEFRSETTGTIPKHCPLCKGPFFHPQASPQARDDAVIANLLQAMRDFVLVRDLVDMEFVISPPSPPV